MNIIRKNIDIPFNTAKGLVLLAAQEGIPTKHLMEKILTEYESKINHKKTHNYKLLNPKK